MSGPLREPQSTALPSHLLWEVSGVTMCNNMYRCVWVLRFKCGKRNFKCILCRLWERDTAWQYVIILSTYYQYYNNNLIEKGLFHVRWCHPVWQLAFVSDTREKLWTVLWLLLGCHWLFSFNIFISPLNVCGGKKCACNCRGTLNTSHLDHIWYEWNFKVFCIYLCLYLPDSKYPKSIFDHNLWLWTRPDH